MRLFRGWYSSFYTRLLLSFWLVTSFSVGIIALFSIFHSLDSAKEQYELRLGYSLDAANSKLEEWSTDLNLQMLYVTLLPEVIDFASRAAETFPDNYELLEHVTFRYALTQYADYVYFLFPGVEKPFSVRGNLLDGEMERLAAEYEPSRAQENPLRFWARPFQVDGRWYLCYFRKIFAYANSVNSTQFLGYLVVCLSEDRLGSTIRDAFAGSAQDMQSTALADELLLTGSDGVIYSASSPALIGKSFTSQFRPGSSAPEIAYDENGKRNLVAYHANPKAGYTLAAIVDYATVSRTATAILQLTTLVVALCAVSGLLFGNLVTKRITRPVIKLTKAIDSINENNLESHLIPKYNDEFSRLWNSFSDMTLRLRQAQDNAQRVSKEYVRAQHSALVAQINPHFLHNTLATAIFLIENGNTEESVDILSSLSWMFRINMQIEAVAIEIGEELHYLRHYMDIQKIRFQNFQYIIDVPFSIQHLYTLKLILQPLVENAVQHGVCKKEAGGLVMIRGWTENDDAVFEVIDNGDALSPQQAEKINASMRAPDAETGRHGIGIKNVNDRLVFQFGGAYGVQLLRKNGYTVCRVTTKAWEGPENGNLRPYL